MVLMTEMTNNTPRWAVDSQVQRTKADNAGNITEGYEVNFHTRSGHYGTVFVPMARYTPENVAAAVDAQARQVDAVGQLTSED